MFLPEPVAIPISLTRARSGNGVHNQLAESARIHLSVAPGLTFTLQPIMQLRDGSVFGHEMLYRGQRGMMWEEVDLALIMRLQLNRMWPGPLFINISHQSLLTIPPEHFVDATRNNSLFIEFSESKMDESVFPLVCAKVNELTDMGVRIAIDDYGNGEDGMKRLVALDSVAAIKVDPCILHGAMKRKHAAAMLGLMVSHWNSEDVVTIAEGIETPELLQFAAEMTFSMVQGYHVDEVLGQREKLRSIT